MLEAKACNLAEIADTFRVGERDILLVLQQTRVAMVADLMARLKAGKITRRNIKTQRRSGFKQTRRAEADLKRVLRGVGQTGMRHVTEELERQEVA